MVNGYTMSGQPVPSRENHRDARVAKVRRNSPTSKEKNRKFSTISGPVVDNFSSPPRNALQDNAPRKSKLFGVLYNIILVSFFSENSEYSENSEDSDHSENSENSENSESSEDSDSHSSGIRPATACVRGTSVP